MTIKDLLDKLTKKDPNKKVAVKNIDNEICNFFIVNNIMYAFIFEYDASEKYKTVKEIIDDLNSFDKNNMIIFENIIDKGWSNIDLEETDKFVLLTPSKNNSPFSDDN